MTDQVALPHEFYFVLTLGTDIYIPINRTTKHTVPTGTPAIIAVAGRDKRGIAWYDVVFDGIKGVFRIYASSKHTVEKITLPAEVSDGETA